MLEIHTQMYVGFRLKKVIKIVSAKWKRVNNYLCLQYQISWKSIRWFLSCFMYTNGWTEILSKHNRYSTGLQTLPRSDTDKLQHLGMDHTEKTAPLLQYSCCFSVCSRSRYLATAVVQSHTSQSLPSNGSTFHNICIIIKQPAYVSTN
jgi:hypothetical protein